MSTVYERKYVQRDVCNRCMGFYNARRKNEFRISLNKNILFIPNKYNFNFVVSLNEEKTAIPFFLMEGIVPLPRMLSYAPIQKNFAVEDEPSLINLPYIDDLRTQQEMVEIIREYSNEMQCDRIQTFLPDECLKELMEVCRTVCESTEELIYTLSVSFPLESKNPNFITRLENIARRQEAASSQDFVPNIDSKNAVLSTPEQALSSYTTLFCRRCFKYDCTLHRQKQPIPKRPLPYKQMNSSNTACSLNCHYRMKSKVNKNLKGKHKSLKQTSNWTNGDKTLLRALYGVIFDDYCLIAKIMNKPCSETKEFLVNDSFCSKIELPEKRCRDQIIKKKIKRPPLRQWSLRCQQIEINSDGINTTLSHYQPCDHAGPCNDECRCIINHTFCEKFCLCDNDCLNKFRGCRCRSSCNSKQCPCFLAVRECDPDLCSTCGAGSYDETITCTNVCIQRLKHKHLFLSQSDVAGWGIFLNSNVRKNEFIAEYCGEIVSQEEAERRGRIYDRLRCSFLFNLNNEFVVDATRKANKIRFANHSIFPNCYAKVMMVNGDHRIGIYARRSISAGEELFFDYRYGPNHHLKFVGLERQNICF